MENEKPYYIIQIPKEPDQRNYVYGPFDSESVRDQLKTRKEMYSTQYDIFIAYRMGRKT
jgi:hypothetical protein